MAETQPQAQKAFPVSWDQFHRDDRSLTWRLAEAGPFSAIVCITRGGLVPAAIVARELNLRVIGTVCVSSYDGAKRQGELQVLKGIADTVVKLGGPGERRADRRRPGRHWKHRQVVRQLCLERISRLSTPSPWAGRWSILSLPSVAGYLDLLSLGHRACLPAADPRGRSLTSAEPHKVRKHPIDAVERALELPAQLARVLRGEVAHALRIIHGHTAKQQEPEHQFRHDDLLGPPWLLHADARMVAPLPTKLGLPNCVKLLTGASRSFVLPLRVGSNSRKRLHQFVQNDLAGRR